LESKEIYYLKRAIIFIFFNAIFLLFLQFHLQAQFIIVTVRGIYSVDIKVYPLFGDSLLKTISQVSTVRSNQTALIEIPASLVPGEFSIRYDYRLKDTDASYPSEHTIFIGRDGASFEIDPTKTSDKSSILWRSGEAENKTWDSFLIGRQAWQSRLAPMRQWLESEGDTGSKLYRQAISEFEKRRFSYHRWLDSFRTRHSVLFVSHLMPFAFEPPLVRKGQSMSISPKTILSGIDLKDSLIVRSSHIKSFFNAYFSSLSSANLPEDSLRGRIHRAASEILDLADNAHPAVGGWIVDYLYEGFLASGMESSIPMLSQRLNDLGPYSKHATDIFRKTMAMGRVAVGLKVPDILIPVEGRTPTNLRSLLTDSHRTLLLFWSATCPHCIQLVDSLAPYSLSKNIRERLRIVALSIDRSDADAAVWERERSKAPHWVHAICREGVNSEPAKTFGVLATPTMFLLSGKEGIIESSPETFTQLRQILER